jgi:hypothetical protein
MAEPADTDDNEEVTKEKFDIGSGDNKQYQRLKVMVMLTLASNFREAVQIIFFSFSLLILIKPIDDGLVQPLPHRLPGVGYARPTKPCRWRGKQLHHGGDVCVLVFN